MTTPAPAETKPKPSLLKIVGWYILAWVVIAAIFVGYVSLAPNNGGFTRDTAHFTAMFGGMLFVPGLIYVLFRKGGVSIFPKPHKEKSYYDDLSK
jgi:hypothetical protein